METQKIRFCKICSKACSKVVSHSRQNPGREYFCCPTSKERGGHGWVAWVDSEPTPSANLRSQKFKISEDMKLKEKEKCSLSEDKLKVLKVKLHYEQDRSTRLEQELGNEKSKNKCLKKCLNRVTCISIVVLFLFWISK